VVAGDDFGGGHDGRADVGDVALQPDQVFGALQGHLVQTGLLTGGLHETDLLGRFVAVDDGLGTVALRGEGVSVPGGPFVGVPPDGSPRLRMFAGVPYRFGAGVQPLGVGGGAPHRDGVDDLPVGERVAVPVEMLGQVQGCFGHPRADDEP